MATIHQLIQPFEITFRTIKSFTVNAVATVEAVSRSTMSVSNLISFQTERSQSPQPGRDSEITAEGFIYHLQLYHYKLGGKNQTSSMSDIQWPENGVFDIAILCYIDLFTYRLMIKCSFNCVLVNVDKAVSIKYRYIGFDTRYGLNGKYINGK